MPARPPTTPPPPRRKKRASRPRAAADSKARAATKPSLDARVGLSPRARGALWGLSALLATLGLAVAALLLGFGRMRGHDGARAVEVDWPAATTAEEAAAILAELGVVDARDTMAVFLRATGGTDDFVPGPHLLFEGATPWELRRMLARSMLRPFTRVTIPEGFNRFDIATRLEKLHVAGRKAFLAASADPALLAELRVAPSGATVESAEGYLFPATYDMGKDSDPRELVRRLVSESDRRWEALSARHQASFAELHAKLGWSRREIVVLASMIEKEAAVDEDRPLIASVFVNRLLDPEFKTKRLQSDPTSSYGCVAFPQEAPSCASFAGKPTPAMNRDPKNRYNTYAHSGLPPGPIANPGVKSLAAALAPAATRHLYFVHTGGGRHSFSETFDQHNAAVHRKVGAPDGGPR